MARIYHTCETITSNILYVKYAPFEPTEQEFDVYLNDLYNVYNQKSPFTIILDGTDAKYLSSSLRIKQGKWLADNREMIQKQCIAQIYVIPNIIVKMILQGIFLVQKPFVPYFIVGSKKDALAKAQELMTFED